MPFAGYDDFDDCVSKNRDKKDPEAYCAEIQRRSEKMASCSACGARMLERDLPAHRAHEREMQREIAR